MSSVKVAVIGAGFYGLSISEHIARMTGAHVEVLERAGEIGAGASWANQARVHGGYHYPRDLRTAARSRSGLARFKNDFGAAIFDDFEMLYAISLNNSKVTASQFRAFCSRVAAPLSEASKQQKELFDFDYVEDVFLVDEPAFNSSTLLEESLQRAQSSGVAVRFATEVISVSKPGDKFLIDLKGGDSAAYNFVVDCTYSGLGTLFHPVESLSRILKIERAEITLVSVPGGLSSVGVTVMDGPFFSLMPFPTQPLHSFTHVTYTPRWTKQGSENRVETRDSSAFPRMQLDAARIMPVLRDVEYRSSIFVDKAILTSSEIHDARPILISEQKGHEGYISVLGSKIDTVYDAIDSILETTSLRSIR